MNLSDLKNRIAVRLAAAMLVVGGVPLLLLELWTHHTYEAAAQESSHDKLADLAASRAAAIDQLFAGYMVDLEVLASAPLWTQEGVVAGFSQALSGGGLGSPEYLALHDAMSSFVSGIQERLGLYDVFLIDPEGRVVYSVAREADLTTNLVTGPYAETGLGRVFREARDRRRTANSAFGWYEPSGEPASFLAAPILAEGELAGVLAIQLDKDRVRRVLADPVGLGASGAACLVPPSGAGSIECFSQDGWLAVGAAPRVVSPTLIRAVELAQPEVYLGQGTLAVLAPMDRLDSRLLFTIDQAESTRSTLLARDRAVVVGGLALLLVIGLSMFAAGRITRPLRKLSLASTALAAGNLSVRVSPSSLDEVGRLAESFNSMAVALEDRSRRMEAALGEAQEASAAKSRFLSVMSHEFRTPMNHVIGVLTILEDRLSDSPEERELLTLGRLSASQLLGLLTDLVAYSELVRPPSRGAPPPLFDLEPVDAGQLVTDVVRLWAPCAKRQGLRFKLRVQGGAPTLAIADPVQLRRCVERLFDNVFRFAGTGTTVVEVGTCHGEDGGTLARIAVIDSGPGVPPDQRERIFEPFTQVEEGHTRSRDGAGLGLALCWETVRAMGGQIGLRCPDEGGTEVWMTFPAGVA